MGFADLLLDFESTPTVFLTVLLLCLTIRHLLWRDTRKLPPAPWFQLPIIGHMHNMKADIRKMVRPLRRQFGDIYRLQLGNRMVIVLSGHKTLKEAFVKNADLFTARPSLYTLDRVTLKKGFANKDGPIWTEHRRFVLSTLKDLGMGRRVLETKVLVEADRLVQLFKDTDGKPFYPKPMVMTAAWNVISSLLFGDSRSCDPMVAQLLKIIEFNLENVPTAGIFNFLPFLRWMPGDSFKFKQCVKNADVVNKFSREIVEQHMQEVGEGSVDDLTNAYIKTVEQKKADGENTTLSMDNLSGVISDLYFAGTETTSTMLSWCIVCLVAYPDVQKKLYDSITACLGLEGTPSMGDRTQLIYVEAFYTEVLRFCGFIPVLFPHAVTQDTEVLGYTIPSEAIVFVDLDSVDTDQSIWGDPENFRPERFIASDGKLIRREEFVSFFFGKRSCVGESLARMELFLIITCLVQKFEFMAPDNDTLTLQSVEDRTGLLNAPKPYNVVARMRKT